DDGGARGRLTADFAPDTPGFMLGPLVPPFDAAEEAAREREIIALLTRRREEQKGVVLEKLARFFDREPAVVASLLSAAGISLDDRQTLHAFYAGIPADVAADGAAPV